jgi:hypothetical protein
MTLERLQEIKTRLRCATDAAWHVDGNNMLYNDFNYYFGELAQFDSQGDVDLIVHAPQDLTDLIARVESLEQELEIEKYVARAALEWFAGEITATHDELRERILRERP